MRQLITIFVALFVAIPIAKGETQIWLAPISQTNPQREGAADYMDLFAASSPWSRLASHVAVLKLYPFFVGHAPNAELRDLFKDLNRRKISLALEARVLVSTAGCDMPHGDGGEATIHLLERIKLLGGKVTYLAMDEPLKHTLSGNPSCRGTIAAAAADVTARIGEFRRVFPNILVGDIEPIGVWKGAPDLLSDTLSWVKIFREHTGRSLAFFHADVGWTVPWFDIASDLQQKLRVQNVPFGMIYNGNDLAASDAEWSKEARQHYGMFENGCGPPPDAAIFQSWVRFPSHVLPESNVESLTGIALSYLVFHGMIK